MNFNLSKKLLDAYSDSHKTPNYSLMFILNSVDPSTCTAGVALVDDFSFSGESITVEIDDNSVRTMKALFGKVDSVLIEKMLWLAFMLPEM